MAKSVFQKKKRIAHFQNSFGNFAEEGDECLDYVASIIQKMDSNFNSLQSDCANKNTKAKATRQNNDSLNSPTLSSIAEVPQNSKSLKRKLSASRKFPLMEKSQKILKQLKHNRSVPKPRAHLAALPKSPVKVDKTPRMSRKNKVQKERSESSHSSCSNAENSTRDSWDVSTVSSKRNKPRGTRKKGERIKSTNLCKDLASADVCESSVGKNASKESASETSDSEYERFVKMTKKDLPKKTPKRQKHSVAKSKASRQRPQSRARKKIRVNYDSDDSDALLSNHSTEVSSSRKQEITHEVPAGTNTENGYESDRIVDDVGIQDSSSESDTANNEVALTVRTLSLDEKNGCSELLEVDSSCESDATLPDVSSLTNKESISDTLVPSGDTSNSSNFKGLSHSEKNQPKDATLPNISSLMNKGFMSDTLVPSGDTSHALSSNFRHSSCTEKTQQNDATSPTTSSLMNIGFASDTVAPSVDTPNALSSNFRVSSDSVKARQNDPDPLLIIDLCDSDDDRKSSEHSTVSSPLEHKCSARSGPSDAYHSDQKQLPLPALKHNADQNVVDPDSEDSDLEIIEVVAKCPQNNNDVKCDAVYMTNICNEFSWDKVKCENQRTLINSESLETSSKDGLVHNAIPKKVVKVENGPDDDIVVLHPHPTSAEILPEGASSFSSDKEIETKTPCSLMDSLQSMKHSAHKFLRMDTECGFQPASHSAISTDMDSSFTNKPSPERLETSCPVACVDSKMGNTLCTKKEPEVFERCSDSNSLPLNSPEEPRKGNRVINKSDLIELYKREFDTYQEIVHTEKSVGASLKLLEKRQAERVKYIQSLVQKYVESSDARSAFKRPTDGKPSLTDIMRDTEQIKPSFMKEEFSKNPPPTVLSPHPATSATESDIKPHLYSLEELENAQLLQQSTVRAKSKPGFSGEHENSLSENKQTLLNERCNVCGKGAVAACQGCAKVFFCSHKCGRKFWNDGHVNECCS